MEMLTAFEAGSGVAADASAGVDADPGNRNPETYSPPQPQDDVAELQVGTPALPKLADLSRSTKLKLSKRLTDALDDVLEAASDRADVHPSRWDPAQQEFFIAFTRSLLMHGMLAHDEALECGANERNLPDMLLLFGLRPALEGASDAWAKVGDATGHSPVRELVALAGPFQVVVGDRVDDDDLFICAQKRIYSELDPPA